ncbi:MAG: hypothetical protein ACTSVY_14935 [Candidatus Helarchaeota archaeon]
MEIRKMFCKICKKEVVIFSASYSADIENGLDKLREQMEKEGKLILFNPPPFGPYKCPICRSKLEDHR